jgi:hypothetical protein
VAVGIVVFVVLTRLLVRRVWIADLLASLFIGAGILGGPWVYQYPVERVYSFANVHFFVAVSPLRASGSANPSSS